MSAMDEASLDLSSAFEAHAGQLRAYILARIGNQDVADDVLSQVFECACRQANQYQDRGFAVSSWLYRIAHSRIIDHYRAVSRRGYDASIDDCALSDDGGIAALESHLESAPLAEALGQLATDQRRVIVLRFLLDQELATVAAQLGVSTGAVKAKQHRALERLRAILTPLIEDAPPLPPQRACDVCGKQARARGLCARHYRQRERARKKGQRPRWECAS